MMEIDTVILDDNVEYYVIENILINGVNYVLLSNVDNDRDIKIRKIIIENNEKYFYGIDNDEELNKIILEFDKKINS